MGFAAAFTNVMVENRKEFDRKQKKMQKEQAAAHARAWSSFRNAVRHPFSLWRKR